MNIIYIYIYYLGMVRVCVSSPSPTLLYTFNNTTTDVVKRFFIIIIIIIITIIFLQTDLFPIIVIIIYTININYIIFIRERFIIQYMYT
jgi:hypothetical protein